LGLSAWVYSFTNQPRGFPINSRAIITALTGIPILESGTPRDAQSVEAIAAAKVYATSQFACVYRAKTETAKDKAAISQNIPAALIPASPASSFPKKSVVLYRHFGSSFNFHET
jgi:hypothetical protein